MNYLTGPLPHEHPLCQRWNHRTPSWRPRREGGFDQRRYTVLDLDEATAKQFVTTHHYSGAWPAAVHRYGLWDHGDDRLCGVLVLAVPMHRAVLTGTFPQLDPYTQSLELSRLVLLDEVPANAESWFCTRVFQLAAAAGLRGLVAHADPAPRQRITDQGTIIVSPGHVGTVYQACSGRHTGRTRARWVPLLPDGTVLTDRAIAKLAAHDQGSDGVIARLLAFPGAAQPQPSEDLRAWLTTTLQAIGAARFKHPGNHRYAFALGTPAQRRRIILPAGQPYPKRHEPVTVQ